MSIRQTKEIDLADITDGKLAGKTTQQHDTRVMRLVFPLDGSVKFVFSGFAGEAAKGSPSSGKVVIHCKKEPQPAEPPEDVIDPETGEVQIAAGSIRQRIPSVEEIKVMPLPQGKATINNFSELFDTAKKAIYLAGIQLNPDWSDGVEA